MDILMRRFALITFSISLMFSPLLVRSDPLDAVLKSAEKVKSPDRSDNPRDILPADVDPESSYGRLFVDSSMKDQIFLWLGDAPEHFIAGRAVSREFKELVSAKRKFVSSRKVEVVVNVLIPHPAYISMVQFNLLKEFTNYLPAPMLVDSTETMDLRGYPGTLYRLKDGKCSVVVRMAKETMVVGLVPSCDNSRELTEVMRALDLKRLDAKISS